MLDNIEEVKEEHVEEKELLFLDTEKKIVMIQKEMTGKIKEIIMRKGDMKEGMMKEEMMKEGVRKEEAMKKDNGNKTEVQEDQEDMMKEMIDV